MPRPERPVFPVAGALIFSAAWFVVAHEGGAGWVQLLGDVVWAVLLAGLVGPLASCARAHLEVHSAPGDAVAGTPTTVVVEVDRRLRVTPVEPAGPPAALGRRRGAEELVLVPGRRGVHRTMTVELATAAPFGILWWRRRIVVALGAELEVGPRVGEATDVASGPADTDDGGMRAVPAMGGDPRAVREYRPGDHRRWVHWPVTAHLGELAVREMETPSAEPVVVDAALPADSEAAERRAEQVLGTVLFHLGRGREVVLVTIEESGPRRSAVRSRVEAGRRLARAVPGAGHGEETAPKVTTAGPARHRGAPAHGSGRRGVWWRVRQANRPGPAEHSVALRVACAGAVLVGIAAVRSQGEISGEVTLLSGALLVLGMVVSYRLRTHPPMWMKGILAVAAIGALVWFVGALSGQPVYDVSTVETPLATLFVAVLVIHSFDVPARRDLSFSIAGSAILMAVAGAQATDMSFGLYVLAWMAVGVSGLLLSWRSASGGGRLGWRLPAVTAGAVVLPALVGLLALPAPVVGGHIAFPVATGNGSPLALPFGLAGDGRSASEPARPGSPSGASRMGGFTGFAQRLDTALRGPLGSTVIMRVRAERPSYWVGETFDRWDGQSWLTDAGVPDVIGNGSPFTVPATGGGTADTGTSDLQTFYVVQSTPNLVFHADDARQVWFPTRQLVVRGEDTLVSPIGLGSGAIYTVRSVVATASAVQLRAVGVLPPASGLSTRAATRDLGLPHGYPQVAALVQQVTAGAATPFDKVTALIGWIGSHTRYSTDIPPLPPGSDAVNEFLFGDRVGFCAQISTALAVMLRTAGIPAREAVGYVPGPYNPITDLYDVQARDAHAWVQVWFPGYGWQGFDPTAVVPLANPSPGGTLLGGLGHALARHPVLTGGIGGALLAVPALAWGLARRRRRPAGPAEAAARRIERAGARAGRPRRASETLAEYAGALDTLGVAPSHAFADVAAAVERVAYEVGPDTGDPAAELRRRPVPKLRGPARWRGRSRSTPGHPRRAGRATGRRVSARRATVRRPGPGSTRRGTH
jgi:transglutaminase-like putative cysteine protease/uncharacterized protein (DUF58 family)